MIVNLPKGDLHVHLNGAIPTNLVKELLAKKYKWNSLKF